MASAAERYAAWRERNPNNYEAQRRARLRKRAWVSNTKAERGCERCGEHAPQKLHFHHRDPAEKLFNVSRYDQHGQEALAREIKKCVVLCGPCHRAEHKGARQHVNV